MADKSFAPRLILISLFMLFVIVPIPHANAYTLTSFSDVHEDDWFYENIKWGVQNHIVSGYDDGTFVPDAKVTEAEFLKMLISAYSQSTLPPSQSDTKWYAPYYRFALDKKWNVTGLYVALDDHFIRSDLDVPNKPIIRLEAGSLLLNALGEEADAPDELIWELYNRKLSEGKGNKNIWGYHMNDLLTRAEAVTMIRNFTNNNSNAELLPVRTTLPSNRFASISAVHDKLVEITKDRGLRLLELSTHRKVKEEGYIVQDFRIVPMNDENSLFFSVEVVAEPFQKTTLTVTITKNSYTTVVSFFEQLMDHQEGKSNVLKALAESRAATNRSVDRFIPPNRSYVKFDSAQFNIELDESDREPFGARK